MSLGPGEVLVEERLSLRKKLSPDNGRGECQDQEIKRVVYLICLM